MLNMSVYKEHYTTLLVICQVISSIFTKYLHKSTSLTLRLRSLQSPYSMDCLVINSLTYSLWSQHLSSLSIVYFYGGNKCLLSVFYALFCERQRVLQLFTAALTPPPLWSMLHCNISDHLCTNWYISVCLYNYTLYQCVLICSCAYISEHGWLRRILQRTPTHTNAHISDSLYNHDCYCCVYTTLSYPHLKRYLSTACA